MSGRYVNYRQTEFNEKILDIKRNVTLFGYFQSAKYFTDCREILLDDIQLNDGSLIEPFSQELLASNSVAIHIRRGDYLEPNLDFGLCTISYYLNAMAATHYYSPVGRDNLSSQKNTKYRALMRFYCHIYPEVAQLDETRFFASRVRRYVWKAALYRCLKLDFRFLAQFVRVLFKKNPTPDNIDREAGIAISLLGYSKRG